MVGKMATMLAANAAARRCVPRQTQHLGRKMHSTMAASTSEALAVPAASSGPPIKRYLLYTTAIMFGIPGAIGAVFVHNLKTDDEFYSHFNDRYPDLIAAIHAYIPLDSQQDVDFASRTDIGPITPTSELLDETVTVIAELASRLRVRFQVQGDASEETIHALALSHSQTPGDRVVSITIDDDAAIDSNNSAVVVESVDAKPSTGASSSTHNVMRPGVGWQPLPKAAAKTPAELHAAIDAIRVQQAALEESKFAGRDVDEADDAIEVLEKQKAELKQLLPRKRFLWIF